jgi:hypothetical protein
MIGIENEHGKIIDNLVIVYLLLVIDYLQLE